MSSARPEVVVVTGASAGVGRAVARAFARRGARVGLLARGLERLEDAAAEVRGLGGEAVVCPTDVADAEGVELAAREIEERLGPIDVWINNAMTSVFSPVKEMEPAEYERVLAVTFLGTVNGTLCALKRMLPRDRGRIVQVGSALAYRSIPLQSAYCAAKRAAVGFTDSLRSELIHDRSGVRVAMVHLPAMNTPQFDWARSRLARRPRPLGPVYQPEVAAEAIYWAAHHDRRELFVGASTLEAVLGQKWIPALLDRYLARAGYAGQQDERRPGSLRADNLWRPAPGRAGAHGRFDDGARSSSLQTWCSERRGRLGSLALAAAAFAWRRLRRGGS